MRLDVIDGLKGLGILYVMLAHTVNFIPPMTLTLFQGIGRMGVLLLIISSGFLYYGTINKYNFKEFIKKKVLRLVPLYYLALLFNLFLYQTGFLRMKVGEMTYSSFFKHLIFIEGLNLFWFVPSILALFLIFYNIKKLKTKHIIILFILSLIIVKVMFPILEALKVPFEFIKYIPFFLSGIIIRIGYDNKLIERTKTNKYIIHILSISIFLLFLSLIPMVMDKLFNILHIFYPNISYFFDVHMFSSKPILLLMLLISIFVLTLNRMTILNKLFKLKFFTYLGKHSYGIYLFHYFIINFVVKNIILR